MSLLHMTNMDLPQNLIKDSHLLSFQETTLNPPASGTSEGENRRSKRPLRVGGRGLRPRRSQLCPKSVGHSLLVNARLLEYSIFPKRCKCLARVANKRAEVLPIVGDHRGGLVEFKILAGALLLKYSSNLFASTSLGLGFGPGVRADEEGEERKGLAVRGGVGVGDGKFGPRSILDAKSKIGGSRPAGGKHSFSLKDNRCATGRVRHDEAPLRFREASVNQPSPRDFKDIMAGHVVSRAMLEDVEAGGAVPLIRVERLLRRGSALSNGHGLVECGDLLLNSFVFLQQCHWET